MLTVDRSFLHSTLWHEDIHVRVLYITMVGLMNEDGVVEEVTLPQIARMAGLGIGECTTAMKRITDLYFDYLEPGWQKR